MRDEPNHITPAGDARITDEIEALVRVERPRVVQEVQDAAAQRDRSEFAKYIYGRQRLREDDRRQSFIARRLKRAVVVDPVAGGQRAQLCFGVNVEVEDEVGVAHT